MRLWVNPSSDTTCQRQQPKRKIRTCKRGSPKKAIVQHWRKLLSSNELRRSVMLRKLLGPKGQPGASAINDNVLSGHFDSLSTQGSPMPKCWKKMQQSGRQCSSSSHPLSRATNVVCKSVAASVGSTLTDHCSRSSPLATVDRNGQQWHN